MAPGWINTLKGVFLFEKNNFRVNVNTVKTYQKNEKEIRRDRLEGQPDLPGRMQEIGKQPLPVVSTKKGG
jgi:hypothetical protein